MIVGNAVAVPVKSSAAGVARVGWWSSMNTPARNKDVSAVTPEIGGTGSRSVEYAPPPSGGFADPCPQQPTVPVTVGKLTTSVCGGRSILTAGVPPPPPPG